MAAEIAPEMMTLTWTTTSRESNLGNGRGHGRKVVTTTHTCEFDINDEADRALMDRMAQKLLDQNIAYTIV